jgi:hypothetical protein
MKDIISFTRSCDAIWTQPFSQEPCYAHTLNTRPMAKFVMDMALRHLEHSIYQFIEYPVEV